jgi:folate-dependent phosphoribosylglycinamide formyltransferase PurN
MNHRIYIGVLISGSGTNLQAIIDAVEAEKLDAVNHSLEDLRYAFEKAKARFLEDYGFLRENALHQWCPP